MRGTGRERAGRTVLILSALALASCSSLIEAMRQPAAEKPVGREESYLSQGPASDQLDLAPDEKLLIAELSDQQTARKQLEDDLASARQTIAELEGKVRESTAALQAEQARHGATEAEAERLRGLVHEREARILGLHLEKARLTQDVLLLKIDAAERQLRGLSQTPVEADAMPLFDLPQAAPARGGSNR